MKIGIILGTRPEIIKLSPIIRLCNELRQPHFVVHTGQHYSANMDTIFFEELQLPKPQYNLNIHESLHGQMTGKMLIQIEKILIEEKPDWILVQGDTNSVLAGALAASKLNIKIGHVEAGLRSFDKSMPEETNRIITDHISSKLFAPTHKQAEILTSEGISNSQIHIVGNTVVDAVLQNLKFISENTNKIFKEQKYLLLTLHRPSNVDHKEVLVDIFKQLTNIAKQFELSILFPVHPRTKKQIESFEINLDKTIFKTFDPVSYLEMLAIQKNAKLILTDSGGIQEEACILQIPCITLRENTERPETVEVGANILVGNDQKKIEQAFIHFLNNTDKVSWKNPFGSGDTSQQILSYLN